MYVCMYTYVSKYCIQEMYGKQHEHEHVLSGTMKVVSFNGYFLMLVVIYHHNRLASAPDFSFNRPI